ncbi:MAG TPA: hypothetical protein VFH35_11795 [Ramlibacter sp.]|nr:hypothetical protein [Ramlibacter sp.]
MQDLSHRAAVVALLIAGILMAVLPWLAPGANLWPGRLLLTVLGFGVVAAAFFPVLRAAVLGGAVLSQPLFLFLAPVDAAQPLYGVHAAVLALLVGASAVFVREAWQEARWDGVLPLRQEW